MKFKNREKSTFKLFSLLPNKRNLLLTFQRLLCFVRIYRLEMGWQQKEATKTEGLVLFLNTTFKVTGLWDQDNQFLT